MYSKGKVTVWIVWMWIGEEKVVLGCRRDYCYGMNRSLRNADRSKTTDGNYHRRQQPRSGHRTRGKYNYYKKFCGPTYERTRYPQNSNCSDTVQESFRSERCAPPIFVREFEKGIDVPQENVNDSLHNQATSVSQYPEHKDHLTHRFSSCSVSSYNSFSNQVSHSVSSPDKSVNIFSSEKDNTNEINQSEGQLLGPDKEEKKTTIMELIQQVCSDPGADESNVTDRFFRALVSTLLSITDSCPEQKSFIYKILSDLVNVGLSYAQNQDDQEHPHNQNTKKLKVATPFKFLQSLTDIDLLIQALMKHKLDIYDNIYQTVIIDHVAQPTSSKEQFNTIDKVTFEMSIEKVKSEIVQTNRSFNELQAKMFTEEETRSESQVNQLSSAQPLSNAGNNNGILVQDSFLRLPCRSDASSKSSTIERITDAINDDQVCISYGALQGTELSSFCIYDKAIIAGYKNGTLRIFNLESGALLDNVKPHKEAVTSIHVYQDIVITTSLDRTMKLYDLVHHTTKMVIVDQEIFTSCLFKDILYLGTKRGLIFRLNVKKMKQISHPFCVCLKTVNTIQVIEEKGSVLMFIAAEDSVVSIRDGTTGSLLQVFTELSNARCIVFLGHLISSPRICAGFKDKMLAIGLPGSSLNAITKLHSVSCMIVQKGILFAASQDHKIFMYDEKTIDLLNNPMEVNGEIKKMAVWGKVLVVATTTSGITYLDIPKIVVDRWINKED
ncbi:uncharacterized protein isoform X1 [Rhodnius prolixus]